MTKSWFPVCLILVPLTLGLSCENDDRPRESDLARLGGFHEQAMLAQNAGNYVEAERLHRMAVETMERIPDLPLADQARLLSNLASVLNNLERAEEALNLLKRAGELLEQEPTRDAAQLMVFHLNLSRAYALTGRWAEAEDEHRRGAEIMEQNDAFRVFSADADANLAYIYWKTNRLAEAKTLYEQSLRSFQQAVGPNHPAVTDLEREYQELLKATSQ